MKTLVESLKQKIDLKYVCEAKKQEESEKVTEHKYLTDNVPPHKGVAGGKTDNHVYRFENDYVSLTMMINRKLKQTIVKGVSVNNNEIDIFQIFDKPVDQVKEDVVKFVKKEKSKRASWFDSAVIWAFDDYVKQPVKESDKGDDGDGKIETEAEFRQAATELLKNMFKDDYDEKKAKQTIDGLVKDVKDGEKPSWVAAYSALTDREG